MSNITKKTDNDKNNENNGKKIKKTRFKTVKVITQSVRNEARPRVYHQKYAQNTMFM